MILDRHDLSRTTSRSSAAIRNLVDDIVNRDTDGSGIPWSKPEKLLKPIWAGSDGCKTPTMAIRSV
jgi:hypothetical protein